MGAAPWATAANILDRVARIGPSPAAVGMAAQSHGLRIDVPHLDDLPNRRLDALQHVGVGRPGSEVDVGLHDQIPVAHIAGEVGRTAVPRSRVGVQVLGYLLVEPDEHGELLALCVALGNGQACPGGGPRRRWCSRRGSGVPRGTRPAGDWPMVTRSRSEKSLSLTHRSGNSWKVWTVKRIAVGIFRLLGPTEPFVLPGQLQELSVLQLEEARLLGPLPVRR